jgi:hypothetical protein
MEIKVIMKTHKKEYRINMDLDYLGFTKDNTGLFYKIKFPEDALVCSKKKLYEKLFWSVVISTFFA